MVPKQLHYPVPLIHMEKIDLVHLRQSFRRDSRSNEDNDTFIAIARESSAVNKALEKTEKRVNALQTEQNGLCKSRDRLFKTRPIEWIEAKLEDA